MDLNQTTITSIASLFSALLLTWTMYKSGQRDKVINAIHVLSNSAMGEQLKKNVQFAMAIAVMARRIAEQSKQVGDMAAAQAADLVVRQEQDLLNTHLIQQAKVDASS